MIMKLISREFLIKSGKFSTSSDWVKIQQDIEKAIKKVTWPNNSSKFTIFPERKGNGVTPIKGSFLDELKKRGWETETRVSIATRSKPGPLDATLQVGNAKTSSLFAVEWETGNISSSHRALNKMALGILKGVLIGGILVLPTRNLYQYLTDRIGNFPELEPYFPLWKSIPCKNGILGVYAIEHDAISNSVPRIRKGTDGRAIN